MPKCPCCKRRVHVDQEVDLDADDLMNAPGITARRGAKKGAVVVAKQEAKAARGPGALGRLCGACGALRGGGADKGKKAGRISVLLGRSRLAGRHYCLKLKCRRCPAWCCVWPTACCREGPAGGDVENPPANEEEDSSDEEAEDTGPKKYCFGLMREVPEEERDRVLFGGLVEVSEELREFGWDGKVLAVQESNALLIVILGLTFADLIVTALQMYSPLISSEGCSVVQKTGDEPNSGGTKITSDFSVLSEESCLVAVASNITLAIFTVEIFLRLRQYAICKSYTAFFTDVFCVLDFSLVAIDLVVIVLTVLLSSVIEKYPELAVVGKFASNARILRAVRIFRMMRAVRAARAIAKLSANQDLFDAAASGNLAMITKKAKGAAPPVASKGGEKVDAAISASAALDHERKQLWRLNPNGETALHVAAACGHERVVKYLLERKSCDDVDPRDWSTGATPLWNACQAAKRAAARVLLSKGADLDVAPLFGEHRGVTAKQLAAAKHWDDLILEAAEIRAAEEERLEAQRVRREKRRNRVAIARAERERVAREAEERRLAEEEASRERARQRVKRKFQEMIEHGVRGALEHWMAAYFTPEELAHAGTKKGEVLAKRAKEARLDAARLARDPKEVQRRREAARVEAERKKEVRRLEAVQRVANNELRTAWRGNPKKRPKLPREERKSRVLRQEAAPRHGWPVPTVSRRMEIDLNDPKRDERLRAMTEKAAADKAAAALSPKPGARKLPAIEGDTRLEDVP